MMRRTLFISTLVFALLCGCVKNDSYAPGLSETAILFNEPVINNLTKIQYGEIEDPYPQDETFAVFGVYHPSGFDGWESASAATFVNRAEFSYTDAVDDDNDGIGGWAGGYYFPKNGAVSFAAYSPFGAHSDTPGDGNGTFAYGSTGLP